MINITFKLTGIEGTDAIKDYAIKRLSTLEKLLTSYGPDAQLSVELGQTTKHHKQGEIFRAEVNVLGAGKKTRAVSEKEDLYNAIDDVRAELSRVLISEKDRSSSLFRRGARSVKKMLKGLSSRNPWSSK